LSLFKDRAFRAAALAHAVVDLLNGQKSLLLAVFSVPLGLSNALIGLVSALYTFSGSLLQPVFGLLADRYGGRWVAVVGLVWMTGAFVLAVSIPGYGALVLLVLAALGSAAFHPAGTMEATLIGRRQPIAQETTSASVFFLFGTLGFTIGPAIGGPIIDHWGTQGLVVLLIPVVPIALNAATFLPEHQIQQFHEERGEKIERGPFRFRTIFIPFFGLTALRSWTQSNMLTFLPKYFSDLGFPPREFGPIMALFMGGSAVGGVAAGWLADRYGKQRVLLWSLLLAALPLAMYPLVGSSRWVYLVSIFAGAFTGAPHSILVVLAQRMIPGRMGTVSGFVLGFTFASGAIGALISGLQADMVGFNAVFYTSALLSVIAALMALFFREKIAERQAAQSHMG
jgi:FSR family fosmidomycin resistance protein-like MFS transporter